MKHINIKSSLLFLFSLIGTLNANAQVYEMDLVNGMTINTCSGTFYDSEAIFDPASGDYAYDLNEDYEVTFCANTPGDYIKMEFSTLQIVPGEDTLWVYNGPSTASPMIAVYTGGYGFSTVIGTSGCLTFEFKSTGTYVSFGWEGVISCINVPPTPLQPACTNIGFESGNFNGWYGTYGIPAIAIPAAGPTSMTTGPPGAPTPNYFPSVYGGILAPYHTITSGAGLDPYGGFPVVSPNGGANSIRLGDLDNPYYGGSSIEQKFTVTPANAMMIYSYAVVIQNALDSAGVPHLTEEQPYFEIEAFDCVGNSIPCGDYLVVGGPNIPGFTISPLGADAYYKPWTDVFLDLTPYIGSCVTIRFTQGDCTLGAHFSYVYLDAMCGPLEIVGPQYICPGEFVTLEAPPGGASYLWAPGGQTTQSITVSPAAYTDYTCTVTPVTGPACTTTLPYWVDVYPPASVVVNSESICAGTPVTLTATPNSAGGSFNWSPGGDITSSITVSPMVPSDYIVTFTDVNGCTAIDTAVISVDPSPTPIIVGTLDYCQGTTTTLSTSQVYPTYLWSTGDATPTVDVTIADNTIFITVTNAEGCTGIDSVDVIENTEVVYASVIEICQGDSAMIHGNWEFTSGLYSQTFPVISGCDSVMNVTLTVFPLPNVFAGVDVGVCDGAQVILTGSGATNYLWNNGVVDGVPFTPTSGWYTVTGTDQNGCVNIDSLLVTIDPVPDPTFIVDFEPCEPYTVTLTNTTPGNFTDCTWQLSNGTILNGCGPLVYTFPNSGTFDITLTTTSDIGCIASVTVLDAVYFEANPNASFSPGTITLSSLNTTVQFNNTSTGADTFIWEFGDETSNSNEQNPNHTFPDDGSGFFQVMLVAFSPAGCPDTAYSTIAVDEELIFYVPNTFTPDGDDYNEYFRAIFSSGYDPFDFHLLIFNRWGEIIWESFDDSVGWDGTYNGNIVQDGTYTWKIDFKVSSTDERQLVVGHVNIIR
ncbi:MAG: gliding motility-associated C-terminal domain-containing protein [Crocinitomicaceae bacterium]|nr:gliding motility-associated C-terminal domain-containing protein [Crocinitomicaceae bacterium]